MVGASISLVSNLHGSILTSSYKSINEYFPMSEGDEQVVSSQPDDYPLGLNLSYVANRTEHGHHFFVPFRCCAYRLPSNISCQNAIPTRQPQVAPPQ